MPHKSASDAVSFPKLLCCQQEFTLHAREKRHNIIAVSGSFSNCAELTNEMALECWNTTHTVKDSAEVCVLPQSWRCSFPSGLLPKRQKNYRFSLICSADVLSGKLIFEQAEEKASHFYRFCLFKSYKFQTTYFPHSSDFYCFK